MRGHSRCGIGEGLGMCGRYRRLHRGPRSSTATAEVRGCSSKHTRFADRGSLRGCGCFRSEQAALGRDRCKASLKCAEGAEAAARSQRVLRRDRVGGRCREGSVAVRWSGHFFRLGLFLRRQGRHNRLRLAIHDPLCRFGSRSFRSHRRLACHRRC